MTKETTVTATTEQSGSRRAQIVTAHEGPVTARQIAESLIPDNTDEMATTVENEQVLTTITRETTGGLHATVDDYLVNLRVAAQLITEDAESSTTTTTITNE